MCIGYHRGVITPPNVRHHYPEPEPEHIDWLGPFPDPPTSVKDKPNTVISVKEMIVMLELVNTAIQYINRLRHPVSCRIRDKEARTRFEVALKNWKSTILKETNQNAKI